MTRRREYIVDVNHAEITISAVSPSQYPSDQLPEVALAGRSNVGKSSFINTLINRKSLARTSSKPGKTRTINFYKIENTLYFADVPGYGYAKVSKTEMAKWGDMMNTYFTQRETLKLTVLVVDFRHPPSEEDKQMLEFLLYHDLPVMIVATKSDKIKRSRHQKHLKQIADGFGLSSTDEIFLFSSELKEGKDEAWEIIEEYIR